MESDEVLRDFFELCNSQSGFLQYHIASNAVVDWFGRTIRGSNKIYQFYRYDLCQQYVHCFQNAQHCDPIERKPSHMQTKQLPPPLKKEKKCCIKDTEQSHRAVIEYNSTNQSKLTSKFSALIEGGEFPAICDDDLTDLGLAKMDETITPPQNKANLLQLGEPAPKKIKYPCKNEELLERPISIKTQENNNKIPTKKESTNLESIESESKIKKIETQSLQANYADNYSDLMYIEVIGTLKLRNKTKHRGVTGSTHSDCYDIEDNTHRDRETKIKISYRIRKDDQQVQFALIIYEHISRNSALKRNLLKEFEKINIEETKSSAIKGKKSTKLPQVKRKIPLQRSLRLF